MAESAATLLLGPLASLPTFLKFMVVMAWSHHLCRSGHEFQVNILLSIAMNRHSLTDRTSFQGEWTANFNNKIKIFIMLCHGVPSAAWGISQRIFWTNPRQK